MPSRLLSLVAALVLGGLLAAAPATAAEPLFGFNDNAVGQRLVSPATDADALSKAGARVSRLTLDWRWTEARRGVYQFATYDAIYGAYLARGIRPVLTVMFAPSWAIDPATPCNQYQADCRFPPGVAHDGSWRAFLATVAQRYPQAAAIELWNEPNLAGFWQPRPDAARYAQLLRSGFEAIKAVAPSMTVLNGGLSNLQKSDLSGIALRGFLASMYANGAKGAMDGISVHPYPGGMGDSLLYKTMDDVRDVRGIYGDAATPIWVTEVGVSTGGVAAVTAADQARSTIHLYRTLSAMPDVRALLFHTLFQQPFGTAQTRGYALLSPDGVPTPAYCLLAALHATGYACPAGVTVPAADPVREADWRAQARLHSALDAVRAYFSQRGTYVGFTNSVLHAADARLSSIAPLVSVKPGPGADSTQIRIYQSSAAPKEVMVCNASTGSSTYCIWVVRGRLDRYHRDAGSIATAAYAMRQGATAAW
jgi:hypothetical protein